MVDGSLLNFRVLATKIFPGLAHVLVTPVRHSASAEVLTELFALMSVLSLEYNFCHHAAARDDTETLIL